MLKKPASRTRKQPRQARAQATCDAILTATERCLVSTGYDALTTNRVAEVAGVGIGTLYQYFPDKDALVAAVFDREFSQKLAALDAVEAKTHHAPLGEFVHAMVRVLHQRNPPANQLRRQLVALQVRFASEGRLVDSAEPFFQRVERYLVQRRSEVRDQDPRVLAFMVVHTLESLMHMSVLANPPPDPELAIAEMTRMVLGYLQRANDGADRAQTSTAVRPVERRT